jgi:hypothetical protein
MMDFLVEAQNSFKAQELPGGCATLFKARQATHSSLLVHARGYQVTGLKTYRGQKRKEQLGVCSLPSYYARETVVGAETRPALIAVGAVDQSPYRVQQIDPHGDSVHIEFKNQMRPAV